MNLGVNHARHFVDLYRWYRATTQGQYTAVIYNAAYYKEDRFIS